MSRAQESIRLSLARNLLLPALLCAPAACGSAGGEEDADPPEQSSASNTPAMGAAGAAATPVPAGPSAEMAAAIASAVGGAAERAQAACGATLQSCTSTPGCNEILQCAVLNGCSGSACYCSGSACAVDGPCKTVITSAPGARAPDAASPSLGPATDAAVAVGACLTGAR